MTKEFYRTGRVNVDHTRFGGLICYSDFNTDFRGKDNNNGSPIASDIASDWKFDEKCRKNVENKNRNKTYKKGNN